MSSSATPSTEPPKDVAGTTLEKRGPNLRTLLIIGALAIVLIVVGLLAYPSSPADSSSGGGAKVGHQVPSFSLPALDGSSKVGVPADGGGNGTAAVLIFFASWCGPCRTEMPALSPLLARGEVAGAKVIGIDALDATGPAKAFVTVNKLTFPIGVDPVGTVTNGDFGFPALPEVVFVSPKGIITEIHYGVTTPAQLEAGAKKAASS